MIDNKNCFQPRKILSIRENVREGVVTGEIEAFDPDTTTKLKYTIDWSESYASKPGFNVEPQFYEGWVHLKVSIDTIRKTVLIYSCFIIEEFEETNNKVFGILSVNTSFQYNIDYEKFEVVYLSIIVEDVDQEIMPNTDSAFLVVRIEDENDNPPEFVGNTLTVSRNVIEEAVSDTLIGTIIAIDIDGPGFNIIQYNITYGSL